jgi:hypothetical protein
MQEARDAHRMQGLCRCLHCCSGADKSQFWVTMLQWAILTDRHEYRIETAIKKTAAYWQPFLYCCAD